MLYENNKKAAKLDKKLFEAPTAEYRATPFWAWNCDLDRDELCRQIDIFKEMGYGGYHMHVRTGMSTTYMSDEFMALIKACVEHGKEKEMISWLYDEDRWPSGAAGGYVTKDKKFRRRRLEFTTDASKLGGKDPEIIASYDITLDENKCLKSYKIISEGENAEGTVWTAYITTDPESPWFNNQTYVDTLNPKAIEKFIEVTHDVYAREVGDEFGKSIPSIFTDEPQFIRKSTLPFPESKERIILPWTPDLEDTYKAAYGESLVEHLPELFWELPDKAVSVIRYNYHDHVSERFASAFADTCGNWCKEHGIMLTGHMMEEPTLLSQTCALGDAMRSYRSFGLPGIDMLCNRFEFTTAKQCQSAVHQYGRVGMLSELDGVTGWDFDFRGHKLHGDWQAALGVTVRVPHLAWVSMKGNAKRDYPASISYQSSWHKEYAYIEDHFARVNTALTRGKPLVRVGVIHPVESYWLHWGPSSQTAAARDKLEKNFDNVTQWLLRGSIDFDYICESLLPSQNDVGGAPLKVGEMEYDALVVPECETLRSTTLERLEAFRKAGGKLIFMGDAPKYEDAKPSERGVKLYNESTRISFNRSSLLEALDEFRTIEIRKRNGELTNRLVHQIRRDNDGMWLFVAQCDMPYNKDVRSADRISITVKGEYTPEKWNTQTGTVGAVAFTRQNGNTVISTDLYDYDSLLIFLADGNTKESYTFAPTPASTELKNTPFEVKYELSEPNVLMLDMARYALDDGELCDTEEILRLDDILRDKLGYPLRKAQVAQPWVIEDLPTEHTATLEFEINSEIKVKGAELALEDADKAVIKFNGKSVKYVDTGYYTDMSIRKLPLPEIKKGKNILRVTLPFGKRTDLERMYILGSFGVKVAGRRATVTELPKTLAFDDITKQGLPFYGGAVRYIIPVNCPEDAEYVMRTPHYRAAVLAISVDGKRVDTVAYSPYMAKLGKLNAGKHEIAVDAYISRHNCFGHVHCADESLRWIGPACWFTTESTWTYEYRLLCEGVISSPIFYKKSNA